MELFVNPHRATRLPWARPRHGPGTPIGQAGQHEALTGDERVDACQHHVEHLIVCGQMVPARDESGAGQVRIDAPSAVALREEGFHEPSIL
jgi:hypothetical protein